MIIRQYDNENAIVMYDNITGQYDNANTKVRYCDNENALSRQKRYTCYYYRSVVISRFHNRTIEYQVSDQRIHWRWLLRNSVR
jgi:hypothetical protein